MFPRVSDAQDVCAGFPGVCQSRRTQSLQGVSGALVVTQRPLLDGAGLAGAELSTQPRLYRNHFLSLRFGGRAGL